MGNATDLMASSRMATVPSHSGAIIELYSMTTERGGHKYVVELYGVPVAEGTERDKLAGVYEFLMGASQAVLGALLGQVNADDRTPLEV